ncbi:MAG: hypothetical protein ACPLQP_10310 [Moorellaceae bacterium]
MLGLPDSQCKFYCLGNVAHLDLAGTAALPLDGVRYLRQVLGRRIKRFAQQGRTDLAWYGLGTGGFTVPAVDELDLGRLKALAQHVVERYALGFQESPAGPGTDLSGAGEP